MSVAEVAAFDAEAACVLNLARRRALVLEEKRGRPLHHAFANEASRGLVDKAEALLMEAPSHVATGHNP